MQKGILISIEGPDGAGKSTQLRYIEEYFNSKNIDTVFLREPGGTAIGEKIREILLDKENKEMAEETEMLLYAAARSQLVREKILPYLKENKVVVCDRYIDSSLAYQGYGRKLGDKVLTVNEIAIDGLYPKLTILLSMDENQSQNRLKTRSLKDMDRIEIESMEFHRLVAKGYLELAQKYDRIFKIDGNQPIEIVSQQIKEQLDKVLKNEL